MKDGLVVSCWAESLLPKSVLQLPEEKISSNKKRTAEQEMVWNQPWSVEPTPHNWAPPVSTLRSTGLPYLHISLQTTFTLEPCKNLHFHFFELAELLIFTFHTELRYLHISTFSLLGLSHLFSQSTLPAFRAVFSQHSELMIFTLHTAVHSTSSPLSPWYV